MRRRAGIAMALASLAWAAPAAAAPLGLECAPIGGLQRCDGLTRTWDGVPLDTTVVLPAGRARGLPLVVSLHGFGNSKHEYLDPASTAYTDNAFAWARAGYAVLTYTARGEWGSCGTIEARLAHPGPCARGYIHLADTRYEVRDAQHLTGRLVDEGVADPARIGVTGDSYGGGQSLSLAALSDRVMLPDGRLVPWRSPRGTPIALAAAAPVIPWSDLVGAIAPNGLTRANGVSPLPTSEPVGVFKLSVANAILAAAQFQTGPGQPVGEPFIPGRPIGYLTPPGTDRGADVISWVLRSDLGEPYDTPDAADIVDQMQRFHSAYGIERSSPPPPLFVGAGFTDDLFPVSEVLRFTNRMARDHPSVPVKLLFGDFGHQRSLNKPADRRLLLDSIHAWFDHHVRGDGPAPGAGVTATTQTCPRERPSGGPFTAPDFPALARGAVRHESDRPQVVFPLITNPLAGFDIDPVTGGGDGCKVVDAGGLHPDAGYRLDAAPAGGWTLLGAPRIEARLRVRGGHRRAQLIGRLWDLAPDGRTRRLVGRGFYRPSGGSIDRWELHPSGWRFEPGHRPYLELLGSDVPFARPSNAFFSITVQRLALTLPIREQSP